MKTKLTIQNYRCFVRPTTIEIAGGFSSFVGVNNAGKSAIMRFFLEFRVLFQLLSQQIGVIVQSINGDGPQFGLLHTYDNEEVFSNLNSNPIKITLEFEYDEIPSDKTMPTKISIMVKRNLSWQSTVQTIEGHIFSKELGNAQVISQYIIQGPVSMVEVAPRQIHQIAPRVNLMPLFEMAEKLSNTVYIGPFRNMINVGARNDYLDIEVGDAFIKRFRSWKAGASKRQNLAITNLTNDIRKIFEYESLDISPSEGGETLHITINDRPYKQHELGSGFAQFVLVLANASIKSPNYILIDEPELNLHPRLQLDFLTTLASYASDGVWFSTHSLGLSRVASDRIYSVQKMREGDSKVTAFEDVPRLAEFLGEMSFSSHKELGFKKILLVEGPTEVRVIQQILRKMSKDHEVVLLPLSGRITGDMSEELGEVMRITTNLAAMIDSEKTSAMGALSTNRAAFVHLCETLGIKCHVLERRATENYFSDGAVKSVCGSEYRALGAFEALKDANPHWAKSENWRLARAMSTEEFSGTDLGKFLIEITA